MPFEIQGTRKITKADDAREMAERSAKGLYYRPKEGETEHFGIATQYGSFEEAATNAERIAAEWTAKGLWNPTTDSMKIIEVPSDEEMQALWDELTCGGTRPLSGI